MIYVGEIGFIALNILMAFVHSVIIKKGEKISHGVWGGAYLVCAVVFCIIVKSWWLIVCLLLIRKIFFDLSLNLFRGLPLFYVSSVPASIIDRLHNSVFGNRSEVYMSIYMAGLIVLNFFL